jgi:hypothetical protein
VYTQHNASCRFDELLDSNGIECDHPPTALPSKFFW